VGVHTKNGTYYFYHLRKIGSHDFAFYVSNETVESWKRVAQWDAVIRKHVFLQKHALENRESGWFKDLVNVSKELS
jgi:hypothetical protein